MVHTFREKAMEMFASRRRRIQARRVVAGMMAAVMLVTTYALMLPAVTLESHAVSPICGWEEHEHSDACYENVLICTDVNREGHAHSGDCYPVELICGQEEDPGHAHEDACIGPVCGQEEDPGHAHADTCYGPACGLEETEGHTHGDSCYGNNCGRVETEGHIHGADCYTARQRLTCTAQEGEGHAHSDACYGSTCDEAESEGHAHSDACYTENTVLSCGESESAGHSHGDSCYDEEGNSVCSESESAGHSHGDGCYTTEQSLSCGQSESAGHAHDDSCTGLICGQSEYDAHTHADACYVSVDVLTCDAIECAPHSHSDACIGLICKQNECAPHSHSDACTGLICGEEERDGHTHEDACMGLACGEEEREGHAHEDACEQIAEDPACGKEECEPYVTEHVHDEAACYERRLICALPEHEHDDTCYPELYCEKEVHTHSADCFTAPLICTDESEEHAHSGSCYGKAELVCEIEEHAHGYFCYRELFCGLEEHAHDDAACYEIPLICDIPAGYQDEETGEYHIHGEECYGEPFLACEETAHAHTDECCVKPEMMVLLPEGAEIPEGYTAAYSAVDPDNRYAVAVYATESALPSGSTLVVELLEDGSDAHAAAEKALNELVENGELEFDVFVAMDIHFEVNGEEVEPGEPVFVCINAIGLLPENIDPASVAVQHHAEEVPEPTFLESVASLFGFGNREEENEEPVITVQTVADDSEETGLVEITTTSEDEAVAVITAFEVESFSTFTATAKSAGYETINTGVVTYEESGIDFNLYNYSTDINRVSAGGDWRELAHHMTFAGSEGLKGGVHFPHSVNSAGYAVESTEEIQLGTNKLRYERNLDSNGFPVVSEVSAQGLSEDARSVGYLFGERDSNGDLDHAVSAYENIINTPLQKDADGYYYYKSYKNAVDYVGDETIGEMVVYTTPERGIDSANASLRYSGLNGVLGNAYAPEDNPNDILGDFFPFNSRTAAKGTVSGTDPAGVYKEIEYYYDPAGANSMEAPDYWFGASMSAGFYQPKDGLINNQSMVFDFSGDDDVLVYIDGILVMDLGGAHSRCDGAIDFTTGFVETYFNAPSTFNETYSTYTDGAPLEALHYNQKHKAYSLSGNLEWRGEGTGKYEGYYFHEGFNSTQDEYSLIRYYPTTIYECYAAAYKENNPSISDAELAAALAEVFEPVLDENGNQKTVLDAYGLPHDQYRFKDYSEHSFKWYYMERYSSEANFNVRFNLPTLPDNSVTVEKAVLNDENAAGKEFDFRGVFTDEKGDPLEEISYSVNGGTIVEEPLVNGVCDFALTHGDKITFNLAYGYSYDIVELDANLNNYNTSWSCDSQRGTLDDKTAAYMVCYNELIPQPVIADKTVNGTDTDDMYIELSAYATGETVTLIETIPTDIVLVVDQSGTMLRAMNPSQKMTSVDQLDTSKGHIKGYYIAQVGASTCCFLMYDENAQEWKHTPFATWTASSPAASTVAQATNWAVPYAESNFDPAVWDEIGTADAAMMAQYGIYQTRFGATYDALTGFLTATITAATAEGIDHRIAIVGFSSKDGNRIYYDGADFWTEDSTSIDYTSVFKSVLTESEKIWDSVGEIYTGFGNTDTPWAIEQANNIFAANDADGRSRMMILVTDGEPWRNDKYPASQNYYAYDETVDAAWTTKNDLGATVYAVGALDENNAGERKALALLDRVSSNYPSAKDMDGTADKVSDKYYANIDDAQGMQVVFKAISSEVGKPSVILGVDSILRDKIDPNFVRDTGRPIQLMTADYNGSSFADPVVTAVTDPETEETTYHCADGCCTLTVKTDDAATGLVEITGFDYSKHFVASGSSDGLKLVVRVPITPAADNPGGVKQNTNTADDPGIYDEDDNKVVDFPDPYADVPTKLMVRKVLEGATANGAFGFQIDYTAFTGYDSPINLSLRDPGDSNYLPAATSQIDNRAFTVKPNRTEVISNAMIGRPVTVSEPNHAGYNVSVSLTYREYDENAGAWVEKTYEDGYSFDSVSASVTITALRPYTTVTFTNKAGDIVTNKEVDKENDKDLWLELSTYTTGTSFVTNRKDYTPTDIVLTLDLSCSMTICANCNGGCGGTGSGVSGDPLDGKSEEYARCPAFEDTVDTHETCYSAIITPDNYAKRGNYAINYCDICGGWFTDAHNDSAAVPHTTQYFIRRNENDAKIIAPAPFLTAKNGSTVYPEDVDITNTYFTTYNSATVKWCDTCQGWFNQTQNHWTATGAHGGNRFIPADDRLAETYKVTMYKGCVTRGEALQSAVKEFIDSVYVLSKGENGIAGDADDVEYRIALTTFAGDGGTGVYSGTDLGFFKYSALADDAPEYGEALQDISDDTQRTLMKTRVDEFLHNYGTFTCDGIAAANNIFAAVDASGDTTKRNRMTVVFTDGEPALYPSGNATVLSINNANTLKNTYNSTVFAIGCFDKSDSTVYEKFSKVTAAQDQLMHLISSNYPDATAKKDGTKVPGDLNPKTVEGMNYYLTVANAESMLDSFEFVVSEVVGGNSTTTLDGDSILLDTLSEHFKLDRTRSIEVYGVELQSGTSAGNFTFDEPVRNSDNQWYSATVAADNTVTMTDGFTVPAGADEIVVAVEAGVNGANETIKVSGFEYGKHYVAANRPEARQIVVRIPIIPDTDNLGGVKQNTNTADDPGIYDDDEKVADFPDPYTDVPTKVMVHKILDGATTNTAFKFLADYTQFIGYGQSVDLSAVNAGDSNYLPALTTSVIENKELSVAHNRTGILSDVLVGQPLTVSEPGHAGYSVSVSLTYKAYDKDTDTWVEKPYESGYSFDPETATVSIDAVLPYTSITFTNKAGSINTDKEVEEEDDKLWVELSAYTTGTSITTKNEKGVPLDIVLVIDESRSMQFCGVCGQDYRAEQDPDNTHNNNNPVLMSHCQAVSGADLDITKEYRIILSGNGETAAELRSVKYCPECELWVVANLNTLSGDPSNHFDGSGAHGNSAVGALGALTYVDGDGNATYTTEKVIQKTSSEAPENVKGNKVQVYVRQFYTVCPLEESRWHLIQNALDKFLSDVAEDAKGPDGILGTADDIHHNVSIVGFGSSARLYTYTENGNLVLKSRKTSSLVNDDYTTNAITTDVVENAFLDATSQMSLIHAAADALKEDGSTQTFMGMDVAEEILANNPLSRYEDTDWASEDKRSRLVVVFTDGMPVFAVGSSTQVFRGADEAVAFANTIKNTHEATVYTVGLMEVADATIYPDINTSLVWEGLQYNSDETLPVNRVQSNRFLHLLSSNYPDAVKISENSVAATGELANLANGRNYYLAAKNAEELNDSFVRIYEETVEGQAATNLDKDSILRDTLSGDFKLDRTRSIEVYGVELTGGTSPENFTFEDDVRGSDNHWYSATVAADNSVTQTDGFSVPTGADQIVVSVEAGQNGTNETIRVSGFEYDTHYVAANRAAARQIVVRIPIIPADPDNGVIDKPTNDDAGIDEDGEEVKDFPDPYTDSASTVRVKKQVIGATGGSFAFSASFTKLLGYNNSDSVAADEANGSNYLPGDWSDVTEYATMVNYVTDADLWTITGVKPGSTIRITEDVPAGYNLTVEYSYTDENGVTQTVNATGAILNGTQITYEIPVLKDLVVTFKNTTGPVLPSTGGIGAHTYLAIGTFLTLSAGLVLIQQNKRREEKA